MIECKEECLLYNQFVQGGYPRPGRLIVETKMGGRVGCILLLLLAAILVECSNAGGNVSYDNRALLINGRRRLLISGSIHYPRSTPEMWPDLIRKAKDGGLDVIQTYVFWNGHEPIRNQYNFEGRYDIVKFVKLIAEAGLYVHLRIGPYVCAEWNYGGFPLWLRSIPGMKCRTDNEPFKAEMQDFTALIVDLMKKENLFASQGGPIILSQIENEYGNIDSAYGPAGKEYINWAANMATSLDTGVPWAMCQQKDAPDPIINTCNGFYCDQFSPNSKNKPKMWTENWSGWFLSFGGTKPYRPVEDLAFSVARFFQLGGTFQNYYMYHGGTNFGRTSGGPFISTSYDYDAPIDEYGLLRQPKWGHLKDLHVAIKLCEESLLSSDPLTTHPVANLEFTVYKTASGNCSSAFLANIGNSEKTATFNGNSYNLPPWSVSILPDCKAVAFNTAKISSISAVTNFTHQPVRVYTDSSETGISNWNWMTEPVGLSKLDTFSSIGLLEQISTTNDLSDYMWYSLRLNLSSEFFGNQEESLCNLLVQSLGHGLHAYVNQKFAGQLSGNVNNRKVAANFSIMLSPGMNTIDLLSLTVGLQNYGAFFDLAGAGITGPVKLLNPKNGNSLDLSNQTWRYQIGLKGEELNLQSTTSSSYWNSMPTLPKNLPLIWYKTTFDSPPGVDPIAIDFTGMGKGHAWVNGQSIGRYWPTNLSPNGGCTDSCNYIGAYGPSKCRKNCGLPSQSMYHVPRSWVKSKGNVLTLFEELGGDPTQISFATKQTRTICSHVSDTHPLPIDSSDTHFPTLSLKCPNPREVISKVHFASFGNPKGRCGRFRVDDCNSSTAFSIVEKACIGLEKCHLQVSTELFGDPCIGKSNSLAVEVSCS